ncbi:DsrE family protein [Thioalkalivibrio sp.]|uniref:DsrE family protein n=1 Tax=Thioalkalivibrio sp. TaxID=2093813 RepID=UPI003569DF45
MTFKNRLLHTGLLAAALAMGASVAHADRPALSEDIYKPASDELSASNRLVFQASRDDRFGQVLPLNNAQNTVAVYGDDAFVEIVAYGPGIKLLLADGVHADRVASMAASGINFSACSNTMTNMGLKEEDLVEGVKVVNSGVVRIHELQRADFTYVRP